MQRASPRPPHTCSADGGSHAPRLTDAAGIKPDISAKSPPPTAPQIFMHHRCSVETHKRGGAAQERHKHTYNRMKILREISKREFRAPRTQPHTNASRRGNTSQMQRGIRPLISAAQPRQRAQRQIPNPPKKPAERDARSDTRGCPPVRAASASRGRSAAAPRSACPAPRPDERPRCRW